MATSSEKYRSFLESVRKAVGAYAGKAAAGEYAAAAVECVLNNSVRNLGLNSGEVETTRSLASQQGIVPPSPL